jgi:hypothetical protein
MIEALCDHLSAKPGLYLDKIVVLLYDEFHTMITTLNIRRALKAKKVSLKRRPGSILKSEMPICENYIYIIYRSSDYII